MVLVLVILVGWVLLSVPVALVIGRAARAGSGQTRLAGGPSALVPSQAPHDGIRRAAA